MRQITLGTTGITTPQNAFGCLPVQRTDKETAVYLLRKAFDGGMTFFDTARAYSDSEEKLGAAFGGHWDGKFVASKTHAHTPEEFRKDLETSLRLLKTDHLDIYQFHQASQCYFEGDGTGMYEEMLKAKKEGKILHIGCTTHRLGVAEDIIDSGLYETLQFPLSYLSAEPDIALVRRCENAGMGFIAMKGLSGGMLTDAEACMAFMSQFGNVLPIWGIQRESELDAWLSFMDRDVCMSDEIRARIEKDRKELGGDFCRGCGYCAPCTKGIQIFQCARMSPMIRRSPSAGFLSEYWQKEMEKITECINCGACLKRCPYQLNIPELLKRNLEDYRSILKGETDIH